MHTYAVYHRKTLFEIDIFETDLLKLHWPADYRLVASVEADNLDQVFAKTQHIDQGYAPIPVENRQRIQEIGVEKWREEQAAKVKAGYNYFDAIGQRILKEKGSKD